MTPEMALRVAEHIHGHIGWLSAAALLHPTILLRNPARRAKLAVCLAAAIVTANGLLGACMYPGYRERLRQDIFAHAPAVGWLFERKEHLAVGAIGFAWIGCIAHLAAPVFADDTERRRLAVLAHRAFGLSFLLCLVVACLGVIVATTRTF